VLVEHADEEVGLELAMTLREAGFAVAICPGPEQPQHCPLTGPEGCASAHGADAIVSSLGLERPEAREVLLALRTRYPQTPLVIGVSPDQQAEWRNLVKGCELVVEPVAPSELVAVVQRALAMNAPASRE
jgi:DNA-binding response OmpR family regulator